MVKQGISFVRVQCLYVFRVFSHIRVEDFKVFRISLPFRVHGCGGFLGVKIWKGGVWEKEKERISRSELATKGELSGMSDYDKG